MGIYTKTGDKGQTSLFDGQRVKKYSSRVYTYGTFDECNAHISLAAKLVKSKKNKEILDRIQSHIFYLSAEVATMNHQKIEAKSTLIEETDIHWLEEIIDDYTSSLPPVKAFILPGSSLAGAQLHVARTVSRRAERELVKLSEGEEIRKEVLKYMNRLSDCMYILARSEDELSFQEEVIQEVIIRYQKISAEKNLIKCDDVFVSERLFSMQRAVEQKAKELGVPVSMAVVDQSGNTRYSYRMKDALLVSLELATKKAYTAVAMKKDTHELSTVTQPNAELYQLETSSDGKLVSFGGGLLLHKNREIIGAVGISGGSVEEDQTIAKTAVQRFKKGGLTNV